MNEPDNRPIQDLQNKNRILNETLKRQRDMIDILGHELRTPLTIIKNSVIMLKKQHLANKLTKESLEKYLNIAEENLERQSKLLEIVLSTSQIDNDTLRLNLEKVDLIEVLNQALKLYEEKALKKNIKLIFEKPAQAQFFVKADRVRMQEIVDHLIDNALKYTKQGSVTIKIEQQYKNIILTIKDTGMGMQPAEVSNLGQKFYRTNNYLESSKDAGIDIVRPGGAGLGLYVVFNLIRKMGGNILAESKPGVGTIFTVSIPAFDKVERPNFIQESRKMTVYEKFEKLKKQKEMESKADLAKSPNSSINSNNPKDL